MREVYKPKMNGGLLSSPLGKIATGFASGGIAGAAIGGISKGGSPAASAFSTYNSLKGIGGKKDTAIARKAEQGEIVKNIPNPKEQNPLVEDALQDIKQIPDKEQRIALAKPLVRYKMNLEKGIA